MSHASGCYALPHVARGAAQVVPESGGFHAEEIIDLLDTHAGASFFFAPTMIVRLLESPNGSSRVNLDHLKTIIYGGGPMYVEDTRRALDVLGPKLVQIYGQGEAPMTITGLARELHLDTGPPPLPRAARIGGDGADRRRGAHRRARTTSPFAPGETGEVILRGDVVMKGYWNNPEASSARPFAAGGSIPATSG